MARSPRNGAAVTPSTIPSGPALRTSSRRRQSVSSSVAASTPGAGPSTPAAHVLDDPSTPGSTRSGISASGLSRVPERKAHALRSIGVSIERQPCPFPSAYGGSDACGVAPEDEADEVLMAVCAVCAQENNRALCADDIARTAYARGWLRPPTAAVEPTAPFVAAIRNHLKRCEKATPPRLPLLNKYQLTGAVAEQVLESALHPTAFHGSRPKGTVYYLATVATQHWVNPFDGLDMPKPVKPTHKPVKKAAPKKKEKRERTRSKPSVTPAPAEAPAPVKIRLVLHQPPQQETPETSRESTAELSASMSPEPQVPEEPKPKVRRPSHYLDSSDESDSSSEDEGVAAARWRPIPRARRAPPSPISSPRLSGSPRFAALGRLPQASPFRELFFPSPLASSFSCAQTQPQAAHYPAHSLDNTYWSARTDADQYIFDTSSSEEETRDGDWGQSSGILIRGGEEEAEEEKVWAMEDESKVKEATEALRVLFPISAVQDTVGDESEPEEEPSFVAEMRFKSAAGGFVPLASAPTPSSPIPSPHLRPVVDSSPLTPMSRLPSDLPSGLPGQDVDMDEWMDDGELPVRAEDELSDVDVVSMMGEPVAEDDRRLDTAEWAREAAESTGVKGELPDYPSPIATDINDEVSPLPNTSRASSADTHSPSSRSSELLDFSQDIDYEDLVCGPETVDIDEIEELMRQPRGRGRKAKSKNKVTPLKHRCAGVWSSIGVGAPALPQLSTSPVRALSPVKTRPRARRQLSGLDDGMQVDDEDEAIGPEDFETARLEADARDEAKRNAHAERCAQKKALLEAYRQKICNSCPDTPFGWEPTPSPWSDMGQWGSSDSLSLATPSALSPTGLNSMSMSSLSLSDARIVDPRTLTTPPMHVADGDDLMNFGSGCIPGMASLVLPPPGPMAPVDVVQDVKLEPVSVEMTTDTTVMPSGKAESTSPTSPTRPAPSKRPANAKSPVPLAPAPAKPPAKLAAKPPATASGSPAPTPAPNAAASNGAHLKGCKIVDGVNATVTANIPVFVHLHRVKERTIHVLRRLDTDWVNASLFLSAMGVASPVQVLNSHPASCRENHHSFPPAAKGLAYPPGIVGIWVTLEEAIEIAQAHGLTTSSPLAHLLRRDLFNRFKGISKFTGQRAIGAGFGQPFRPSDRTIPPTTPAPAPASTPATTGSTTTTTTAAAPAKPNPPIAAKATTVAPPNPPASTGDATTASAARSASMSLAGRPAVGPGKSAPAPATKGSLVRGANGVPDGCPEPKRRRATIVGAAPPSPAVIAGAAPTPASTTMATLAPAPSASSAPTTPKITPSSSPTPRLPPAPAPAPAPAGRPGTAAPTPRRIVPAPATNAPLSAGLAATRAGPASGPVRAAHGQSVKAPATAPPAMAASKAAPAPTRPPVHAVSSATRAAVAVEAASARRATRASVTEPPTAAAK